jgi:hypothetical protein
MSQVKTLFDGKVIHVPPELLDAGPGEITIIYERKQRAGRSIWDVVARAKGTRTAEDIDEQLRRDRDEWDDR